MTLSIIIPVYNKEKYLSECIESLLKIKEISYEIILVDDGSKDNSLKICQEYGKRLRQVKVIAQANQGVSVARNTGIENADGKYITFVDADDFVKPEFGKQIAEALNYKADFYQFNYIRWISEGKEEAGTFSLPEGFVSDTSPWTAQISGLEICAMCVWGAIFRTDIIKKYDIRFRPGMKTCEDFLFNIQYIESIENFYSSSQAGYCYRFNLESVTNNRPFSHAEDYEYIYGTAKNYLKSHNASEEDWKLFQKRWIRWNIDLFAGWINQNFSSEQSWKQIECKTFYKEVVKESDGLLFQNKIEQWLLKKKCSRLIATYTNSISKLKRMLGRYSL